MSKELTELENKIAMAIVQGMNAHQILEWHGISYRQYVNCKRHIFRKLGVHRMTQVTSKIFLLFD